MSEPLAVTIKSAPAVSAVTTATPTLARSAVGTIPPSVVTMLLPSGGDDSAALQALVSTECNVILGPGTFKWDVATVKLPRSATEVHIWSSRQYSTKIKLSEAAPRAFDFDKIEAGDTFKNITISDFTVDCNNVNGPGTTNHVVIGTFQGAVAEPQSNINLEDILVERVNTINVPTSTTHNRRNVSFAIEGTSGERKIIRCKVRDCRFLGGAYGVEQVGTSGVGDTTYIDEWEVKRVYHDTLVTPTTVTGAFANFHIGGYGRGGSGVLEDLYGYNSWDVGIEVDNVNFSRARRCYIQDQFNGAFYHVNFREPQKPQAQEIVWENCIGGVVNLADTPGLALTNSTIWVGPDDTSTYPAGHVKVKNCGKYHAKKKRLELLGEVLRVKKVPIRGLTVDGLYWYFDEMVLEPTAEVTGIPVHIHAQPAAGPLTTIRLKNIRPHHYGEKKGAFNQLLRFVHVSGEGVDLHVDGIDVDFAVTGSTNTANIPLMLGKEASSSIRGEINGVRLLKFTGDTSCTFIRCDTNLTISEYLNVTNCDTSQASAATNISFANATQRKQVIARDNVFKGEPPLSVGVASANEITLPVQGDYMKITGKVEINTIVASWVGRAIRLQFTDAAPGKVKNGSNLTLTANYEPTTNKILSLVCDGVNWIETGRT